MRTQTILVIDDEKDFARLVERTLVGEGYDVIVASDGATGLQIAREHPPDLVVLDLTMPGIDGLEVCKVLRSEPRSARLAILVLSARASVADRIIGLEQGADDYLIKPFVPEELVARVKAILRRSVSHSEQSPAIQSGDLVIDLRGHRVLFRGRRINLTATEFRVLELLATHKGRAFSRDEIIESALQNEDAVTERTVDAHIVGIRKALGPAAAYIETVRTIGYCFQADAKSHPDSTF